MEYQERERLPELLDQGRRTLEQAPELYGRSLSAEEYWWLGVGLAAWTLAELGEKPYAAGRLEQLMDELGHRGLEQLMDGPEHSAQQRPRSEVGHRGFEQRIGPGESDLEHLIDEPGHTGPGVGWLQRMVDELALLDAEGLLWPRYQRSESGHMEPTGVPVHPGFGPQDGYFLALGHLGVALAVYQEQADWLPRLTEAIGEIVAEGLTAAHENLLLEFFASDEFGPVR